MSANRNVDLSELEINEIYWALISRKQLYESIEKSGSGDFAMKRICTEKKDLISNLLNRIYP